jgi:hypothetical protein
MVPRTPSGLIGGFVSSAVDACFDKVFGVVGKPDRNGAGVAAPAGSGLRGWDAQQPDPTKLT